MITNNYFEIDETEYFVTRRPISSLAGLVCITTHQKWDWEHCTRLSEPQREMTEMENVETLMAVLLCHNTFTTEGNHKGQAGLVCLITKLDHSRSFHQKIFKFIPYFSVTNTVHLNSPQKKASRKEMCTITLTMATNI